MARVNVQQVCQSNYNTISGKPIVILDGLQLPEENQFKLSSSRPDIGATLTLSVPYIRDDQTYSCNIHFPKGLPPCGTICFTASVANKTIPIDNPGKKIYLLFTRQNIAEAWQVFYAVNNEVIQPMMQSCPELTDPCTVSLVYDRSNSMFTASISGTTFTRNEPIQYSYENNVYCILFVFQVFECTSIVNVSELVTDNI